jgi:zinc transporter 1/2/3
MGIANSFAAGVFLAIGITHLLPEADEIFVEHVGTQYDRKFPYAFFICILSFGFILFIEKIAFNAHELMHDHNEDHEHNLDFKKEGASKDIKASIKSNLDQ